MADGDERERLLDPEEVADKIANLKKFIAPPSVLNESDVFKEWLRAMEEYEVGDQSENFIRSKLW
jgi:hypothetical protein